MDTFLIIFVSIFATTLFVTIFLNLFLHSKNEKNRKELFSKKYLLEYENSIASYLKDKKIEISDSKDGFDIVGALIDSLGYQVVESDEIPNGHEAIIDKKQIIVKKELNLRERNFDVAHEIAHVIRGTSSDVARDPHSWKSRSKEEQICDYFAAALLLPKNEMEIWINKTNYKNLSKKKKKDCIVFLADKKNVSEEVVFRRIQELAVLDNW